MRKLLFIVVFLSGLPGQVLADTPQTMALPKLPSTFRPLAPIGNAHLVAREGRIVRGATPVGHEKLLRRVGFTDVLIFKNSVAGENEREIQALVAAGFARQRVTEIPFRWKDIHSVDAACVQVVWALQRMREVVADGKRALFFHCTVGEDRTGALAGLFRMVFDGWKADQAFGAEMCTHGYANANPRKAPHVAQKIHLNVTPVFAKVATLVESGHLHYRNLNPALCYAKPTRQMYARMRELSNYVCPTGSAGRKFQ